MDTNWPDDGMSGTDFLSSKLYLQRGAHSHSPAIAGTRCMLSQPGAPRGTQLHLTSVQRDVCQRDSPLPADSNDVSEEMMSLGPTLNVSL